MARTLCLLCLCSIAACKGDGDAVAQLDDSDLADLRIEPDQSDPTASHVMALAGVLPAATPITVRDVSTGSMVEGAASETGGFDVLVPSAALEDVYSLQAEGDPEPLVIALAEDRSVVRAWGEGWSSEVGCELHGWAGIIGADDAAPELVDRCLLQALRQDDDASVQGSIEPVSITADTVMRTRSRVGLVDETASSIEVVLTGVDGTEHALGWVATAVDVFETHTSNLALDAVTAIGASIASVAIRSSADSALVVSDVALIGVAKVE